MKPILQLLCVMLAGFVLGAVLAFGNGTYTTLVAGGLAAIAIGLLYCIIFLLHLLYVSTTTPIMLNIEYDFIEDKSPLQGKNHRGTLKIHSAFQQK